MHVREVAVMPILEPGSGPELGVGLRRGTGNGTGVQVTVPGAGLSGRTSSAA